MIQLPEDGSLQEIKKEVPVPTIDPVNVIIIHRPDELIEPGETKCLFATFDRTKEGVKWPGDQFLEKLIPNLTKVKVPEVRKQEVTTKTYTQRRNHLRSKYNQKPFQRENHSASRRPRRPFRRSYHKRPENPCNIEPWIDPPPWIHGELNIAPGMSSQTSQMPYNNARVQNSDSSHLFAPKTNTNNCNMPNNNKRNLHPSAPSNGSYMKRRSKGRIRSPKNRPCGPSFQPDRFLNQRKTHPDRGFLAPGNGPQNMDYNGHNNNPGLLGEVPNERCNSKAGLLGDYPFPNRPFNRNLNDSEVSSTTLPNRNKKNTDDPNSFLSSTLNGSMNEGSYKMGYKEVPSNNFYPYNDGNEVSGQNSHDSIIHISNSAVVYNEEDFPRDGYSEAATSFAPRSNLNSVTRSNFRQNDFSKNARWTNRRGTAKRFMNSRPNGIKYNRGYPKYRNWRTPQK